MLLGAHSYCFYLHGVDCFVKQKQPWERQMNTLELIDYASSIGLEGLQLGDMVFESHDPGYLKEIKAQADSKKMFLEYNFLWTLAKRKLEKNSTFPKILRFHRF